MKNQNMACASPLQKKTVPIQLTMLASIRQKKIRTEKCVEK